MTEDAWQLQFIKPTHPKFINQQPHSTDFDDVYFNDQGGMAESKYVFIDQNKLLERWQLQAQQPSFCIAETGFGTGLNFLSTLLAWQNTTYKPHHLHFISCEKHPLSRHTLKQAHQVFPELNELSQLLLNQWQNCSDLFRCGLHSLKITPSVTLTLAIGDATGSLAQLNATVDAWYLDGFAPKKNPEMWHADLFTEINRLSRKGTTVATFTAASQIKKSLQTAGFEVKKKPGFGKKREMITARFKQSNYPEQQNHNWHPQPQATIADRSVTILGAGIAGMSLAHFFKSAGYHVTVIEQYQQAMQGASGNDLAMVMPLLTAGQSPESAFYLRAFEAALRFYQADELFTTGVDQSLLEKKQQRWADGLQQNDLPTELWHRVDKHMARFPSAGYVRTAAVADRLRAEVDVWFTAQIKEIKYTDEQQWRLMDTQQSVIHQASLLIIANGIHAQQLMRPNDLFLTAKHGMTSTIEPINNHDFQSIQLASGYLIPDEHQQWLCGATFDHLDQDQWFEPAHLYQNHWPRNLSLWQNHPLYEVLAESKVIKGHAAIRATTPDHLPICGPMINQQQFKNDYHDLHHGRHWQSYPPAKTMKNLYVLNGLGSRGYTSAPMLAQYLCAMINAEPLPLEADLCKIIHPNRFLYRRLKKAPNQQQKS